MNETTENDRGLAPLLDVATLLSTLWQRLFMIAAVTLAVVALAVAYVALTRPVYTAGASILVDPRDSRATNFNSVLPGLGSDSAAIASQVSVIQSRDLLSKVFDELHLAADPEFASRGLLGGLMAQVRTPAPVTREARFENFRRHVSVSREGLTYVIDVNVTSHDAGKAARIANAVAGDYKESLAGEKESANNTVTTFLTDKISGLQERVGEAERDVQDFKFRHRIYDAQAGGSLQSQIDQLSTQIGDAQDKADQASSRYQQAVDAGDTPKGMIRLADILSSTTADKLRQEYNQTAASLADAETVYGPRHPAIRRMQAQLAKIRGLMVQEADRITSQLKAERDLAAENVSKLQAKLADLRQRSNKADLAQVRLRQLQAKADAARAVLDDFLKRSQETSQLKGMQISQVRVISRAAPPVAATWPKPKLLLPVSAVLGLMAGCALALLAGPRANVPRREAEAEDAVAPATVALPPAAPAPAARTPVAEPPAAAAGPETETAPALPAAVPARRTETVRPKAPAPLAHLGTYALPMNPGLSLRSMVKAIRIEMQNAGRSPLSLSVLRLLRQIIGRLSQHDEPFVLLVSSIEKGAEPKLAAAMIGIGLQQLDERVLIVEMADRDEEPGPLVSVSSRRGTSIFTDPATRLPTVVVANEADIDAVLARNEGTFDFVVVLGRPLGEPNYGTATEARADLAVFALSESDPEGGAELLRERFQGRDASRKATIVITAAENSAGSDGFRPRLVADGTRSRKGGTSAEG